MDRVRLGVVFINYCRPDLLFEAINSLETVHVLKLFIVDRAKLKSEAPSLAAGWNRGIEAALAWGAEWVLVASDDVLFHSCTVDHLVERARERGYEFLCPYNISTRLGLKATGLASLPAPEEGRDEQAADYSCFLLTPELFRDVGPFDERFVPAYYEDADYNLRLGLSGKTGMLTSYAPFFHQGGASGGLQTEIARRNLEYFIAKWRDIVPWAEAFATTGGRLSGDPRAPVT
jgi:GT2 family glycosyltransferase